MTHTIAIVGCGAIAESFYFPVFHRLKTPVRLFLIDSDGGRAQRAAQQFEGARTGTDYHEILGSVNGAVIAVPHHLHYMMAKDFLEAGVPVLCEKPLAETAGDAQKLVELSRKRKVPLCVNNTRRLAPTSKAIRKLLQEGAVGNPRSIQYFDGAEFKWPTSSGFYFDPKLSKKGVLLDIGAHVIDLICWWLGAKPRLVSSENDSLGGCEAVAGVRLEHNGCNCEVRLSRLSKLMNRYRIEADNGIIEGDVYNWRGFDLNLGRKTQAPKHLEFRDADPSKFGDRLVANFLSVVTAGAEPVIPGSDVLASLELVDEAYELATRFPMPWYEDLEAVMSK